MTGRNVVCVVGLGYIGLPTAAFIAASETHVVGVDINEQFVKEINCGRVPFYEPGFDELLKKVVKDGFLVAQTEMVPADEYIVAVPTPFSENHNIDASYIKAAAEAIAPCLKGGELIVLESTSPPGTTAQMAEWVLSSRNDLTGTPGHTNSVYFAHCPERVLPGQIMEELSKNDRVLGGTTEEGTKRAVNLYKRFCEGQLLETTASTAELAKLTENSFRDVNIAFANELSLICDRLGVDVWRLIELANHHPRVNILQPGPGVGGHCIAVDPWFIVSAAPREAQLIRTAREVNDAKPEFVFAQISKAINDCAAKKIALLGIAFKPDIDDLRESPSLSIAVRTAKEFPELTINIVEPNINELPQQSFSDLKNVLLQDAESAIMECDVVVLLVDHSPFRDINTDLLKDKILVDTRGCWRELIMRRDVNV